MKKSGRRILCYLLTVAVLLTGYTPVMAAEQNIAVQEMQKEEADDSGLEVTAESGENVPQEVSEELPQLNYNMIFAQDGEENQTVVVELGDEGTVLESAVLTYEDGDGQEKTAGAETIAENYVSFLLPMPAEGAERAFISVESVVSGITYQTVFEEKQEMEAVEFTVESAGDTAEVSEAVPGTVIEKNGEDGLDAADIETALKMENNISMRARTATVNLEEASKEPRAGEKYIVVLDPGHGGYDSGAGYEFGDGTKFTESEMVLKIAKYCQEELKKYTNLTVYMTREDDSYVGLTDRVAFAAEKKANLLVSLHLNSYELETAHGAEVLVPRVGSYNTDVAKNANAVARNILDKLVSLGLLERGLIYKDSQDGSKYPDGSTRDYYAIVAGGMEAGIPGIIVEHAFLSGSADKGFLDSDADLKALGQADAIGIAQYFGMEAGGEEYNPTPGTPDEPGKPEEVTGSWKKIDGKWYYYLGSKKLTGWQKIESKWYYLDADGVMQKGWKKVDNKWYYLDGAGVMRTGWQKISDKWYYLNGSGQMQTGWKQLGGTWYYMNTSGVMQTGWKYIGSKWYYLNAKGEALVGLQTIGSVKYYFDQNCKMQTGWKEVDSKWYYMNGSGAVQTGWKYIGSKWYYMNAEGQMQTGWKYIGNKWYYMNGSGHMQTGWQKVDNKWYYLNGSGQMLTGWRKIDNKWYYLNGSGQMQTGWKKISSKWYYMNTSGVMQTGWKYIGDKWYYLNGSGVMQTDWIQLGTKWYYLNGSGAMQTGWQTIGTKKYYFDEKGVWDKNAVYKEESNETSEEELYKIEGESAFKAEQLVALYKSSGATYPKDVMEKGGAADVETFCKIYAEEAAAENIKVEVAFAQAMLETGYLKYGGDVKAEQFNFAGLGATGGVPGNSFKDVREGVRAHIQHLKAYASDQPLKNPCVDTRFTYVERNSAPYVQWLSTQSNPKGLGWAYDAKYGEKIMSCIEKLKTY